MTRTRVLIIILGLAIGEPLGGAERFGVELSTHLDLSRFEPVVCAFWRHDAPSEKYWADHLRARGIEVFFAASAHGAAYPIRFLRGISEIRRVLGDRKVDVVHSNFQLGSVAALLAWASLGRPALLRSAHAGKEWGDGVGAWIGRQIFTRWVFPLTFSAETGVSHALVDVLNGRTAARVRRKRAVWIANGIPQDRFAPGGAGQRDEARRALGLPGNALVAGNVARLRWEKGHDTLLAAARAVVTHEPQAHFVIIGDGEQRETLRRQADDLGLGDAVTFAGVRPDVERLYAALDVFVLPSRWEGLSTVLLEAMASAIPVIASDIPGNRELVSPGRTGWLAPPDDPPALARTILQAFENAEQRRDFARAALRDVVPLYDIAQVTRQYEALYSRLASGRAA